MLFKVPIPPDPFTTLLASKPASCKLADHPIAHLAIEASQRFWIQTTNHQILLDLNEQIQAGSSFSLLALTQTQTGDYLLFDKH